MAKRLHAWISVRPDEEIYRLTRDAEMPGHRAGLRMRVDGKDIDRKRFRHYWLEYYGLAEPAYGVDEDRRRPFFLNFTIDDEDVLTELRKYKSIYSLGDHIELYIWLERLRCESAKVAYQRIYSASYNYTTQIIWLDAVPFAEHPEHVAQLMAGYDLIE